MTPDQITRIANECGLTILQSEYAWRELLTDFAQRVAAVEREACAKECEKLDEAPGDLWAMPTQCAKAIRARGAK